MAGSAGGGLPARPWEGFRTMTTEETLAAIRAKHFANKRQEQSHSVPDDVFYYRHELRYRCRRGPKCRIVLADRQYHGGGYE